MPGTLTLTPVSVGSLTLTPVVSSIGTAVICSEALACSELLPCGELGLGLGMRDVGTLTLGNP
jgi:hypothetical protein